MDHPQSSINQGQSTGRLVMVGLMASAMGSGIFNLPYRANQTGLALFILYVGAAGFFSTLGALLLNRLIQSKGY